MPPACAGRFPGVEIAGLDAIARDAVENVVEGFAEGVVEDVVEGVEDIVEDVVAGVVAGVVEEVVEGVADGKVFTGREFAAKYNIPTTPASSIPGMANRQNPNRPRRRRPPATDFSMFAHTDSEGMNCNPSIFCRTPFSNLGSYIGRFIFVGG